MSLTLRESRQWMRENHSGAAGTVCDGKDQNAHHQLPQQPHRKGALPGGGGRHRAVSAQPPRSGTPSR